jgi:hypothetical protein
MKAWATIGALMSLLASAPAETNVERDRRPESRPPAGSAGHTVQGGSFYVWDEDRQEAEDWARELAQSWARAIAAAPPPGDE